MIKIFGKKLSCLRNVILGALIKALPDVHFHILAHTTFASQVVDLQRYLNVTIYPGFNRYNFENVLSKVDFYLDITIILMNL